MTSKTSTGLEFYDSPIGVMLVDKGAGLLKDEVLGKLLHDNILVSMDAVGFSPTEVNASMRGGGDLAVTYTVHLTRDQVAALPSIYDKPEPKPRKKAKRGKK
jgi:hypothetical protein